MKRQHWQDWLNLILAGWVLLSPLAVGTGVGGVAIGNYYLVGIALAVFSIGALIEFPPWEELVNLILGGWLVISPWTLGFSSFSAHAWNAVIIGILVVVSAGWAFGHEQGRKPVSK